MSNRGLGNVQTRLLMILSDHGPACARSLCERVYETRIVTASQSVSVSRALHSLNKSGKVKRNHSANGVRWHNAETVKKETA